jgi:hypothetical protein
LPEKVYASNRFPPPRFTTHPNIKGKKNFYTVVPVCNTMGGAADGNLKEKKKKEV